MKKWRPPTYPLKEGEPIMRESYPSQVAREHAQDRLVENTLDACVENGTHKVEQLMEECLRNAFRKLGEAAESRDDVMLTWREAYLIDRLIAEKIEQIAGASK